MRIEDIPELEQLIPLFDPQVVESVNSAIGAQNAAYNTERIDILDTYEGASPFSTPIAGEKTDWANGFASSARLNIFSRAVWLPTRAINAAQHRGTGRIYDGDSREFTTKIDVDQWVEANESELEKSAAGQRVLRNYLAGYYDDIDDAGEFLTLVGYDQVTGTQRELSNNAGLSAKIGGAALDPTIIVGGAAVRIGAGTALKMRAGLAAGEAFTATTAASRLALNGRLGAFVGENVKIGVGATVVNELGMRTVHDQALDRTMWDTAVDAATGLVADSTLSMAFFGGSRLIRSGTDAIGLTKKADLNELREVAKVEAKRTVAKVETDTQTLWDLASSAAKSEVPSGALPTRTIDDSMSDLDALFVSRAQLQEEVATLQEQVRNLKEKQLSLFEEVDVQTTRLETGEVIESGELAKVRLDQAQKRLQEINRQIGFTQDGVEKAASKGTVHATKMTPEEVTQARETGVAVADEGMFDRRVFATKEEARAAGYLGAGNEETGFMHDQVDKLNAGERNDLAAALADPSVIDSLRAVRDAISNSETVQAADIEGDLLNALRAIENRSPNLKWNPASLGVGTVQTVKIDQPILYSEVVGFVPTTPAEDILLALKKLGAFDKLEGGVSGLSPMRGGKKRPKAPTTIPPSLGGRYASMGTAQIEDLALDLSNDTTQKAVKAARAKLADTFNAQGLKADADDFTGVGLAGMASQLGTGLAYSTSDNRITSSLYNTFFESPFVTRLYTNINNRIPDNLRVPLERVTSSISKRVSQNEEALVRGFKGFRNKRGKSQTAITPALMSNEARAELGEFYGLIEHLRLRTEAGGFSDADLLDIARNYFVDVDESVVPMLRRTVEQLRQPLPTTGRGRLNGEELHGIRKHSTSLLLNNDVDLTQAVRVLRRAQEMPEVVVMDETSLIESLSIFSRMNDGQIPEITLSDIKAALANPNGSETEFLTQRIVSLWNRRLNGTMNRQTALAMLSDPDLVGSVRLDAVQSQRAYQQQAVRAEMLEKLTDYNLLLQRIEQTRGGQSARTDTAFSDLFTRYEELVNQVQIGRASAESGRDILGVVNLTDKADKLLSDSIDATTNYAARHSDRIKRPGDVATKRARRYHVLKTEAQKLNELLKSEAGFIYSGRSETVLGKVGDGALAASRATMLSRMAVSMTADPVSYAAKSLSIGMAKHLPRSTMLGIRRSLQRVPEAERPELMRMLTAFHDNALHNLSLGSDLGFSDINRAANQASVSPLDKTVSFFENPVSKASFVASGGKWLDDTLRQAGTIQSLSELTSAKGLIVRLNNALKNAGADKSLRDALKEAGEAGNYGTFSHVLRFLSREDIEILAGAIENGRYEVATSQGRIFGKASVEFLAPVNPKADKTVQAAQRRSQANLANLVDSWVEFRSMTVPHAVDRPRARADSQNFVQRVATQFMSAGLAASRTVALQTTNEGMIRRAFFVGTAVAAAVGIKALRQLIRGDDDRFVEEVQQEPLLVLADAIGWSGVTGILGDKALPTLATFFLGENAAYDSRRNLDFAITTPLQAYLERGFAAFTGLRDIATGEEPSAFERRAMRSVFSAGLLDSLLSDAALIGIDAAGAEDLPPFEQITEFVYPDLKEKEGVIKEILNN